MKLYQDCNIIIKTLRRIRWIPLYFFKACFAVIRHQFKPWHSVHEDKIRYYKNSFVWETIFYEWQIKAKWYYSYNTIEEFFNSLDEK